MLSISSDHAHEAIILIDADRQVKFTDFNIPSEDELRMLVEKYLFNSIDYTYYQSKAHEFFREGQKIPALKLKLVSSEVESSFESDHLANKNLVVFLADCAPCQIEKYVKNLTTFEQSSTAAKNLMAIFASNFSASDLMSRIQQYQIKTPVYILTGGSSEVIEPDKLQDEYVTRYQMGGRF